MRRPMRIVTWLVVAAVVVGAAAAAFVASGVYNIAAVEQHTALVYWTLYAAMRQSVRHHAAEITPPPLDAKHVERGRTLYDSHCRQCHGAPGVAPEPFALGLTPSPLNLANMAREWPARDLFWVVKNGIKMSAMPAWEFRLPEQDLWAVVAYLKVLPAESPAQYRDAMAVRPDRLVTPGDALTPQDGDPASRERGKTALSQYGCATCHDIPGVVGAAAPVGPPLAAISRRGAIASPNIVTSREPLRSGRCRRKRFSSPRTANST